MTTHAIHRMIGRALTDRRFREDLLRRPSLAIKDYPLSQLEQSHIKSLREMSLEEFSQKLSELLRNPIEAASAKTME